MPIRRTMEAGCSFVCGHCCSPGRKHEPRTLLFPSLSRYLCPCLSMHLARPHSFTLSLSRSLSFSPPSRSPSAYPPRRRPLSPALAAFSSTKVPAMIPPIVSLDVRRSMVQKFGITVSTMFNRESTHNVECVGLVRRLIDRRKLASRVPRCVIYDSPKKERSSRPERTEPTCLSSI